MESLNPLSTRVTIRVFFAKEGWEFRGFRESRGSRLSAVEKSGVRVSGSRSPGLVFRVIRECLSVGF